MIKWLTKTTEEFRLETLEDVRKFEKQSREDADTNGYQLSSFSYTEKEIKEQGEVIDSYFVVKRVSVFNDAKDPEKPFTGMNYDKADPSTIYSNLNESIPQDPWEEQ